MSPITHTFRGVTLQFTPSSEAEIETLIHYALSLLIANIEHAERRGFVFNLPPGVTKLSGTWEPTAQELNQMNLYLISQTDNTGYDTYDSAVVCAGSAEEARFIHPAHWMNGAWWEEKDDTWAEPDRIFVLLLGEAHGLKSGVICASFNAG